MLTVIVFELENYRAVDGGALDRETNCIEIRAWQSDETTVSDRIGDIHRLKSRFRSRQCETRDLGGYHCIRDSCAGRSVKDSRNDMVVMRAFWTTVHHSHPLALYLRRWHDTKIDGYAASGSRGIVDCLWAGDPNDDS